MENNNVIIIMGVSGCGKSTIGSQLADVLKIPFFDADDFHPQANVDKMASGKPLNDEDRVPWLDHLANKIKDWNTNSNSILACSALKEAYRERLATHSKNIKWVFLKGDFNVINERLAARNNHFFNPNLLRSQYEALEVPKNAITVSIEKTPQEIVNTIIKEIKHMSKSSFGVFGLGVMGKSIALNIAKNQHVLSVYNRAIGDEANIVKDFLKENKQLKGISGFTNIKGFVDSLSQPRQILLMVNAGKTVDIVLESLLPYLDENDIIIDGGNSHYLETQRRSIILKDKGVYFIGCGVSGGEEGAKKGPSMMPSGDVKAYKIVSNVLESIAAKDDNGNSCCTYIGAEGSGHFVKMVHNGIEYAEMQLLSELYAIMRKTMSYEDIVKTFRLWEGKGLSSYLLSITCSILEKKEGENYLLDLILDKAGNKGTGSWSSKAALELGVSSDMMTSAVFARYISSFKKARVTLANKLKAKQETSELDLEAIENAYRFARIINHHQGFVIIKTASKTYNWNLNLSEIARIWTNGCIIKSDFMKKCANLFKRHDSLLKNDAIFNEASLLEKDVKKALSYALDNRVGLPCFYSAYNYWVSMTSEFLPANMIQAQRDFFGAHTYKRIDKPETESFHTNW